MLTALSLFAVGLAPATAEIAYRDSRPYLIYRAGGKSHTIEDTSVSQRGGDWFSEPATEGLVFRGERYVARGFEIVNERTGKAVKLTSVQPVSDTGGAFRCKGAMNLGKTMLWMFGWDSVEVQLEPSSKIEAYEISEQKGELKLLRQAEIPGATGYAWGIYSRRFGNTLLLNSPELKTSQFDLEAWKQTAVAETNAIISPSGKAYWAANGMVRTWVGSKSAWKTVKKADIGDIKGVYETGFGDMLLSTDRLTLTDRQGQFIFPKSAGEPPTQMWLFLLPKVCIGVVWGRRDGSLEGVALDPSDLKVICPVKM